MLDILLRGLIQDAQTDPNVKSYNLSKKNGRPTFEVNVNGNIEQVTFCEVNSPEEMMKLLGFTEGGEHDEEGKS